MLYIVNNYAIEPESKLQPVEMFDITPKKLRTLMTVEKWREYIFGSDTAEILSRLLDIPIKHCFSTFFLDDIDAEKDSVVFVRVDWTKKPRPVELTFTKYKRI